MYVSSKIRQPLAKATLDKLATLLPPDENILAIVRTTNLIPPIEVSVITNKRIISVKTDFSGTKTISFTKEIIGQDIVSATIGKRNRLMTYIPVTITNKYSKASKYADIHKNDVDEAVNLLQALSGKTSPVSIINLQEAEKVALKEKAKEEYRIQQEKEASMNGGVYDPGGLYERNKYDYKVLTDTSRSRLQRKVEKYLKNGYQLEGGIAQSGGIFLTGKRWTQAVSRRR